MRTLNDVTDNSTDDVDSNDHILLFQRLAEDVLNVCRGTDHPYHGQLYRTDRQ